MMKQKSNLSNKYNFTQGCEAKQRSGFKEMQTVYLIDAQNDTLIRKLSDDTKERWRFLTTIINFPS